MAASNNLRESRNHALKSGTLSESDASELGGHFRGLESTSERLRESLVKMRLAIKEMDECFHAHKYIGEISHLSRKLIEAIVEKTEAGAKDHVRDSAKGYLATLESARDEYVDSKCQHFN